MKFSIQFIILSFIVTGCKINQEGIVSPYQKALTCYNQYLIEESNANTCLNQLDELLKKKPNDVEARMLRVQTLLESYRKNGSKNEKLKILSDLQFIYNVNSYEEKSPDWVLPRVYTTLGDLFFHYRKQMIKEDEGSSPENFEKELAIFEAASLFYQQALKIANTKSEENKSRGLSKEISNALDGIYEAELQQFSILSRMRWYLIDGTEPYDKIENAKQRSGILEKMVKEKESLLSKLQSNSYQPNSGLSEFDLAYHISNRELYQTIYENEIDRIASEDDCVNRIDPQNPVVSEDCESLKEFIQKAAVHAVCVEVLAKPDSDIDKSGHITIFGDFRSALLECSDLKCQ